MNSMSKLDEIRDEMQREHHFHEAIHLDDSEAIAFVKGFDASTAHHQKIIDGLVEALEQIKAEGHSDNCKVMKPIRPSYSCTHELAKEALANYKKENGEE
jgi:hypothetical protein